MSEYAVPVELFADNPDFIERAARIGRYLILEEMGYFGETTNIDLALARGKGSWTAQVRKRFSGIYGNTRGCEKADMEVAGELLGVFDMVYDDEALRDDGA